MGRMRWSYRELQCSKNIALRKIFTLMWYIYRSEEVNETFSKKTCYNVMNNTNIDWKFWFSAWVYILTAETLFKTNISGGYAPVPARSSRLRRETYSHCLCAYRAENCSVAPLQGFAFRSGNKTYPVSSSFFWCFWLLFEPISRSLFALGKEKETAATQASIDMIYWLVIWRWSFWQIATLGYDRDFWC